MSTGASVAAVVLILLALSLPAALPAQAPDSLTPGARVRLKRPDLGRGWRHGQLVMLSPDSAAVELAEARDTIRFARDMPGQFEWSQGRGSRTGKGALIGLAIGAGAGLLLGIVASTEECTGFCPVEVGPAEVLGVTVILGGIGAGVGAFS